MQDAKEDAAGGNVQPGRERDEKPEREDSCAAKNKFFSERKTRERSCGPGMADHERDADNQQEERCGRIRKIPPEPGRDIDRSKGEVTEIEEGVEEHHHQDRDPPGKIDLKEPLLRAHTRRFGVVWSYVLPDSDTMQESIRDKTKLMMSVDDAAGERRTYP